MRCAEAEQWISLRVDGETIPPEKGARLDLHLSGCTACRDLLKRESGQSRLLRQALGRGTSPELAAGIVRASFTRSTEETGPAFRFVPVLVPLAAAALLVATGLWLHSPPPNTGERSEPRSSLVVEERTLDIDILLQGENQPMSRETISKRLIVPIKSESNREVLLDVERVEENHLKLASWPYR